MIGVDGVGYVEGFEELVYFTSFGPGAGSYCRYVNVHMNNIYSFSTGVPTDEAITRVAA
jgi:hypothetical protein